ncbi:hypothetical protein T440DRAFT_468824 [Plenodomus tracheiphilus IPT5]|uniref:Uncharacterized protein n=1 Tax=Plenodomus tracheiphilus IPT5 TaxID=1408161 RepID=A0A6A7B6V9_9PLEO|nr:hypothetical protein T440DRAFT_468824 [Plenodomus tracheiphilus IPT5]
MKLLRSCLLTATVLATGVRSSVDPRAYSTNDTERHEFNAGRTLSVGWMLYEGYLPLDLWGPLQIITQLSATYPMTLALINKEIGPVSNVNFPLPHHHP